MQAELWATLCPGGGGALTWPGRAGRRAHDQQYLCTAQKARGACWTGVTKAFFSQCQNSRWDPVLTGGGNESLAEAQSCGDPPQMSVRRSAHSLPAVGLAIEEDEHPEASKGNSTQSVTASAAAGADVQQDTRLPTMRQECSEGIRLPFTRGLWKIPPRSCNGAQHHWGFPQRFSSDPAACPRMTFFISAVFMFQLNAGKYSERFEQHLPILK